MGKKGGKSGRSNDGSNWFQPGANGPHSWGSGPQPKKGCAVTALALAGGVVTALAGTGWGAIEIAKAVF